MRRRSILITLTVLLTSCHRPPPPGEPLFPPQTDTAQPRRNAGMIFLTLPPAAPGKGPVHTVSLRRYLVDGKPQWWLDDPHTRADDTVSEDLFQALLAAKIDRRLPGARRDAGRYGLSDDRYRVQAALSPGGHSVRLGDEATGGRVYAARDKEPDVLTVPARLRDLLSHDRDHFNIWSMTPPLPLDKVRSLQVGPVLLQKNGDSWEVSQAASADHPARRGPARTEVVMETLRTLGTVRAQRILPGSGLRFPGDFPGMKAPIVVDFNVQPAPVVVKVNGLDQLYTGLPCPHFPDEVYAVRVDAARLCFARQDMAKIILSFDDVAL